MKKLIVVLLACFMLAFLIPVSSADVAQIEYLPDGSYFVTECCIVDIPSKGSLHAEKQTSYYASGEKQWTMVLHGSFTYNGTTATCTAASVTYTIHKSCWHFNNKSAWTSGNTAHGSLTMDFYVWSSPIYTVTKSLTITCDADGNVS